MLAKNFLNDSMSLPQLEKMIDVLNSAKQLSYVSYFSDLTRSDVNHV